MTDLFTVVPNPNKGSFNIVFTKPAKHIRVLIFSIDGREIYRQNGIENYRKGDKKSINLNLPKGVYFVQLQSGPNSTIKKVVVN